MWWSFVLFLFLDCGEARNRVDPLVETKLGLIRGLRASDGDYSMFLGIPFARVNESNPFGPSLPYPKFEDTFEAFDDSAMCPQVEEFNRTITGTLDCLHLNIYVPNVATSEEPVPVLIWIYGGGFRIGSAGRFLYGPKFLVRHDVILVTLNYRLGPYGFMCLDTPDVPGNAGLRDQLMALRWIKANIDAFGGDPNQITIFGESAGGVSVDLHLLSEQEPLFNKVIMQSGTAFLPFTFSVANDTTPSKKVAKHLGLDTDDLSELVTFLSGIDPLLVIGAVQELSIRFSLCVEKDFDGVEKLISNYTINTTVPKAKTTSILAGYNDDEQLMRYVFKDPEDYKYEQYVFHDYLTLSYDFGGYLDKMVDYVRHFYIGDEDISVDVKRQLTDFASDFYFVHPVQRSLGHYLNNGATSVYHYVFSYVGERNFIRRRNNVQEGGAAHADEIAYLFDISYETDVTPEDQLIIDRMTTMWTNFVKYGDPTPVRTDLLPEKWLPVTEESLNYLDINLHLSVGNRPFHRRLSFWDLFAKMNIKAFIGYGDEN